MSNSNKLKNTGETVNANIVNKQWKKNV